MKHRILIVALTLLMGACASTPKGTPELGTRMEADQRQKRDTPLGIAQGRPVFIEVASYPQVLPEGDLWTGGVILLSAGREKLKVFDMVEKYKGQKR